MIWRVEHFGEIDSTNTWMVARANEGAPEGLVASIAGGSHRPARRCSVRFCCDPTSSQTISNWS
jgi:hypothetical protein